MFASLLRSNKKRPSETTPLLAALNRYRSRQNGEDSEADEEHQNHRRVITRYDGGDEDEDDGRRQDGPLLPVFSSAVLGMHIWIMMLLLQIALLTTSHRSHPHLQHHTRYPHNTCPTMRNHAFVGPIALAAGFPVSCQTHPATNPVGELLTRSALLPDRELPTVQEGGRRAPGQYGGQQDTSVDL